MKAVWVLSFCTEKERFHVPLELFPSSTDNVIFFFTMSSEASVLEVIFLSKNKKTNKKCLSNILYLFSILEILSYLINLN